MSVTRLVSKPIEVPKGVEIQISGQTIRIKGAKGQGEFCAHEQVKIVHEGDSLNFAPMNSSTAANALTGTARVIVGNFVQGVNEGFERKLTLVGVGYRAQAQGKVLNLTVGFSHPVNFDVPEGITIETPQPTEIVVKGFDKQKVGQVAADIRAIRPPEPYKGKGIRYADEIVKRKEAKKK